MKRIAINVMLGLSLFVTSPCYSQGAGPNILLFDGSSQNQVVQSALSNLGYSFVLTTDEATFLDALPLSSWDLVVIDNPSSVLTEPDPVANYIDAGTAPMILSYWNADDPGYASVVTDRMGGAPVTDVLIAQPLFCWECSDGAWNRVIALPEVTVGLDLWLDDGDEFAPMIGALAVGGFGGPVPAPGRAGLIRASPANLTYLVGMASDNMDPIQGVSLWQNLIETSLQTPTPECLGVYDLEGSDPSCDTPDIVLTWDVRWAGTTSVEIERDGTVIATLDPTERSFTDTTAPDGTRNYTVRATCGSSSVDRDVVVEAFSAGARDHIVFRLDGGTGAIDSASQVELALDALGESWIEVDRLDGNYCRGESTIFWVITGTYPDAFSLDLESGQELFDHAMAGGKIYFESSTAWESDAPTLFAQVDGVDPFPSRDAQPGFVTMNGVNSGVGWDASSLIGIAYAPDQPSEFTDRMVPSEIDTLGPLAGPTWEEAGGSYATGTAYVGDNGARVVCQSWEFGGYVGSQVDLISRILDFLRGADAECYPIHDFQVTGSCLDSSQTLTWTPPPSTTPTVNGFEIFRDGVLIFTASPTGSLTYIDPAPPLGPVTYSIRSVCDSGTTSATLEVDAVITPAGSPDNVILRLDYGAGLIDSASSIRDTLQILGETTVEYTSVEQIPCTGINTIMWVVTGTYPDHFALDNTTAQYLVDRALQGRPIYFEGNDTWGFDPPTQFSDYDCVSYGLDGNDSVDRLDGLPGILNFVPYQNEPYAQDQIGNDSTDEIFPGGGETISTASLIWKRSLQPSGYGVGIVGLGSQLYGNQICQSWEFGGYGGDKVEIMARYLEFLKPVLPPGADVVRYIRGDINSDEILDLSDVIATLAALFIPGATYECLDAGDSDSSGGVDIADAVYTLQFLFLGGLPPAPPFPDCEDPTVLFNCDSTSCP